MIELVTSGWNTSVQDNGRFGFLHLGIPQSGAMDQQAMRRANLILENDKNCAVLECMLQGPILKFMSETRICLSGADVSLYLNDTPVKMNTILSIQTGDILKIGKIQTGVFAYLAVAGGINSEKIFKSRSQYKPVTSSSTVKRGDKIIIGEFDAKKELAKKHARVRSSGVQNVIQVLRGPEFDQLTFQQKELLLNETHQLSKDCSRMGYRFKVNNALASEEIISAPVLPGTIQLTTSGQLIALMRDAQSTGGYARVLQLTPLGINQIAQKRVGSKISFQLIN